MANAHSYDAWGNRYEDVGPRVQQYGYNGEDDPVEEPPPRPKLTEEERALLKRRDWQYSRESPLMTWERGPDGMVESEQVTPEEREEHRRKTYARQRAWEQESLAKVKRKIEERERGDD